MRPARLLPALALCFAAAAAHAAPPAYLMTMGSAGSGPGQMSLPMGVTVDAAGDVFVADASLLRITRFDSNGAYVLHWDPTIGLPGNPQPYDVEAGPGGQVFVSIWLGNGFPGHVRVFDASGGLLDDLTGGGGQPELLFPWGLSHDGGQWLYITDNDANAVLRWNGTTLETIASGPGCAGGEFRQPTGVAVVGGGVLVTDYSDRLQELSSTGTFLGELGSTAGCGQIRAYPRGVAAGTGGMIVTCDALTHRVDVLDSNGGVLESWGGQGSGPYQFYGPFDVHTGPQGRLYVADSWNHRVQVYGDLATPAVATSWGRLKTIYR